jgi:hypothetical protein
MGARLLRASLGGEPVRACGLLSEAGAGLARARVPVRDLLARVRPLRG